MEKNKNIVVNKDMEYFLNPDYINIKCNEVYVNKDDYVYKNQVIGDNLVSSVSGYVKDIVKGVVIIKNDYREYSKGSKIYKDKVSIERILKVCVNKRGLFNKFRSKSKFNNLVVNSLNDSLYVYNKVYLLKENMSDVLKLMNELRLIYKIDNSVLVIKNNECNTLDSCFNQLGSFPETNVCLVKDEYLLENKDILLNKLKINGDTLYLDIEELLELNDLLTGNVRSTKVITISGDGINKSLVMRVKKYSLLKEILDKYFVMDENVDVIVNGLMTGYKISNIDSVIIDDNVESINIMKHVEYLTSKCIKCGKCISICPFGVNILSGKNISKCINCGLCSYVCPSHINLRRK